MLISKIGKPAANIKLKNELIKLIIHDSKSRNNIKIRIIMTKQAFQNKIKIIHNQQLYTEKKEEVYQDIYVEFFIV